MPGCCVGCAPPCPGMCLPWGPMGPALPTRNCGPCPPNIGPPKIRRWSPCGPVCFADGCNPCSPCSPCVIPCPPPFPNPVPCPVPPVLPIPVIPCPPPAIYDPNCFALCTSSCCRPC